MKNTLTLIACAAIASLSVQTTQALNNIFVPATGDWGDTNNWSLGVLPAVGDTAIMNNGRVASVNNAIGTTAGPINVANQLAGFTGGMDVNAGGSLNYNGTLFIGAAGATGLVQIQGGSLTSVNTGTRTVAQGYTSDPTVSTLAITAGSLTAQGSAPTDALSITAITLDISGGTLDMSGGQVIPLNSSIFNITGDAATITMDRLNMVAASRASDWNFTLGGTGVSPVQSDGFLHLAYANINIDGSAYAGPGGIIDLFTSPNVATTTISPANIAGFDPQYNVVFEQDTALNYARLNITLIPEPTTFALLGLGSLALVMTRRRR